MLCSCADARTARGGDPEPLRDLCRREHDRCGAVHNRPVIELRWTSEDGHHPIDG